MTAAHIPVDAANLIGEHRRRVDLIEQCANEAGKAEFERKWFAVLVRCAQWFSSMPLNPELYREPGGAFRCTVETAFYAMRLAGGQKFGTNLSSEKRRRIEPQYNYAVFLAAVCSRLDEPYRHFTIERESDRTLWNPSVNGAAAPWLGSAPYLVSRRAAPLPVERMRTGMLAQMLIGSDLLAGLDADVISDLFGAINPVMKPIEAESLLHKVIRQAVDTAAEFDRKAQRAVFEPVQFSVPSALHVAAQLQPVVAAAPASVSLDAAPQGQAVVLPTSSMDTAEMSQQSAAAAQTPESSQTPHSPLPEQPILPEQSARSEAPAVSVPHAPAINPADMRAPATTSSKSARADNTAQFDEVLKGTPNMIRELFHALREDVAAGTAKGVTWNDKGLVIPKRLIGSYGVTSDTLVEHLRKRSLVVGNEQGEVTLGHRAGQLILDRPA